MRLITASRMPRVAHWARADTQWIESPGPVSERGDSESLPHSV